MALKTHESSTFEHFFQIFHRPTEQEVENEIETNYIDNGSDNYIPNEPFDHDNKEEDGEFYSGVTSEMLEMEVTAHPVTTTTVEMTTIPISEWKKFNCSLRGCWN